MGKSWRDKTPEWYEDDFEGICEAEEAGTLTEEEAREHKIALNTSLLKGGYRRGGESWVDDKVSDDYLGDR